MKKAFTKLLKDQRGIFPIIFCGCILAVLIAALILLALGLSLGGGDGSGGTGGITGSSTTATLSNDIIERIKNNKDIYLLSSAAENIPWEIIAALHFREANNDPNRSPLSGEVIGTTNPDNPDNTCYTLQECSDKAARHIKGMALGVYNVALGINTDEELKNAFLAYNRGYRYTWCGYTYDDSPYVMNQFDDAHKDMVFPPAHNSLHPSGDACETVPGIKDARNGAFTVYVILIQMGQKGEI